MNALTSTVAVALTSVGLLACASTTDAVRYDKTVKADPPTTEVQLEEAVSEACGIETNRAYFAYNSDALDTVDRTILDEVGECMRSGALEGESVIVVGHTDAAGTEPYNESLGMSRSESVAHYLVATCGIPADRIFVDSDGEQDAGDAEGAPFDRRVEIRVAEKS